MTVFYRKYRPQKFTDIVGQDHTVKTLLSQLATGNIGHAYLFAGPKGTGKTSTARIFAKAVNCKVYSSQPALPAGRSTVHSKEKSVNREQLTVNKFGEPCNKCTLCLAITDGSALDLIEIDAASNRNIDDIRDLREKIKLSPVSARFKVYIVDEVHMLTREAFNALLKTLEEPPAHAIFILCTTEPGKLPATIVSRVQKFNFKRASENELAVAIEGIIKKEDIKIDDAAKLAIARAADGSYRDAVSLLDQISSSSRRISEKDVTNLVIFSDWSSIYTFCENISLGDIKKAVTYIEDLYSAQADISVFIKEAVLFLEKLFLLKMNINATGDFDSDQFAQMKLLEEKFTTYDLQHLMKLFLIAESEMRIYPLPHISLLLATCKYCLPKAEQKMAMQTASGETLTDLPTDKNDNVVKKQKIPKSFAKITKLWPDFLNKVKPVNAHVMAVLRSARPVRFDGANLVIEVFYRFHKEKLEEPKISKMLDNIICETMGMPLTMKFILNNDKSQLPKAVRASDVVDIKEAELERAAAEIFSK